MIALPFSASLVSFPSLSIPSSVLESCFNFCIRSFILIPVRLVSSSNSFRNFFFSSSVISSSGLASIISPVSGSLGASLPKMSNVNIAFDKAECNGSLSIKKYLAALTKSYASKAQPANGTNLLPNLSMILPAAVLPNFFTSAPLSLPTHLPQDLNISLALSQYLPPIADSPLSTAPTTVPPTALAAPFNLFHPLDIHPPTVVAAPLTALTALPTPGILVIRLPSPVRPFHRVLPNHVILPVIPFISLIGPSHSKNLVAENPVPNKLAISPKPPPIPLKNLNIDGITPSNDISGFLPSALLSL